MEYYVVKYSGPFGFIKPWTAVRDGKTYSQQFITPSILEGIEKKLFPELLENSGVITKVLRHKLTYSAMDMQQEQTQPRGWEEKKKEKCFVRDRSVIERGILLNPVLYLAFENRTDAERASVQHICLCRNEDVLMPDAEILVYTEEAFHKLDGFELHFEKTEASFMVGFNRYDSSPMYGWLEVCGKPVSGLI